jgi:hypothetical protein
MIVGNGDLSLTCHAHPFTFSAAALHGLRDPGHFLPRHPRIH